MKKAMLFAAGLGTRLKPLTDHMPKALVEVGGHPLLEINLLRLRAEGFKEVVINIHHFASMIREYLSTHDFGMDIRISDESDELLETGGGLRKALSLFTPDEDPILIHNVDILSNAPLSDFHASCTGETAGLLISERNSSRHLLFDADHRLCGWQNMETGQLKTPYAELQPQQQRHYAFSGIHCVSPHILSHMEDYPRKFSIMDCYLDICRQTSIRGYVCHGLRLLDVGKISTLREADDFLRHTLPLKTL